VKERGPAALAISAVAATTAYLFLPLWWGALTGAPRYFEWDVPEQYWPDLVYLCRSLHRGELPYWNPYDRGGYPYYADPQAGAYHPLHWGLCALAGPAPARGWAELRVVLGFACAGGFGLLWLRRLGASWLAAAFGAVAIECAPFMRHNWELNLTAALGWAPMVLWALERLLQERRVKDGALLALASGLLVWTGSPPVMWLAGSFALLYALGRLVELRGDRAALGRALGILALGALLAAGLSAVVLVPGRTLAGLSVQAGRSYASIAEGGLTLAQAGALLSPQDGNHLYLGLLVLLLAPLAPLRAPRLPGLAVLGSLALLGFLLALGDHGPLFRAAFDLVPGVRWFRLPHRYEAWLGLAMAALAAGGLDAVLGWAAPRWPRLEAPRARLALAILLPLLVVLDVTRRMPADRHTRGDAPPGSDAAAAVLARIPDRAGYRVMDEFGIACRSGTRLGLRELRGYQDPLLLHAFERAIASLREHPGLAPQLNVRFALTGPHFLHGWDRHFLPPPDTLRALPGATDRGGGVIEFGGALPMAYVVPREAVERVPRREEALARTLALAPAPIAVLEGGDSGPRAPAPLVPARVLGFSPDALHLAAQADGDAVLVVNETWYPGWQATVDGAPAEVERANGLVRALALGPGDHDVRLRFAPPDGAPLRALLAASWALTLGLLVARRRPGPRGPAGGGAA
jgi:hypothetical protein